MRATHDDEQSDFEGAGDIESQTPQTHMTEDDMPPSSLKPQTQPPTTPAQLLQQKVAAQMSGMAPPKPWKRILSPDYIVKNYAAAPMSVAGSRYMSAMYNFQRFDHTHDAQFKVEFPLANIFNSKMHGVGDAMEDDDDPNRKKDVIPPPHKFKKYLEIDSGFDPDLLAMDPTAKDNFLEFTEDLKNSLIGFTELLIKKDATEMSDAVTAYDKVHGVGSADTLPLATRNRRLAEVFVKDIDYWHKKKTAGDGKKREYAGDFPEGSVLRGTRSTFRRPDKGKEGIPVPDEVPDLPYSTSVAPGDKYSPAEMVDIIKDAALQGYSLSKINFLDAEGANIVDSNPKVRDPTFRLMTPDQVWTGFLGIMYKRLTSGRKMFTISWGNTFTYVAEPPQKHARVVKTAMAQKYVFRDLIDEPTNDSFE